MIFEFENRNKRWLKNLSKDVFCINIMLFQYHIFSIFYDKQTSFEITIMNLHFTWWYPAEKGEDDEC